MGGSVADIPQPFAYPTIRHARKHGPYGYTSYESYRAWLRDEFSFRCVFCLNREQWGLARRVWDLDHFLPQDSHPQLSLDYENLLYTCRTCNGTKSDQIVPDPCKTAYGKCVKVHPDGTIEALNEDGEILIEILRLNNEDYTRFRRLMIDTLRSLAIHDRQTYVLWMRYPEDLPDLSRLRPPGGNSRPAGVNESFYARRIRNVLEETY
jgi:hypothetical protein